MAKVKKETSHAADFAEGGNTHMFGKQSVGTQKPADTAHNVSDGGDRYACGGKGKMFGYAGSQPARSGITSAR